MFPLIVNSSVPGTKGNVPASRRARLVCIIAGTFLCIVPYAAAPIIALRSGSFASREALASTTALAFSNAMPTFYSFVYRPTDVVESEAHGPEYFVHRLRFSHDVAPIFGPYLFAPVTRTVHFLAIRLRALQSGHLNFYLALIGGLLVIILALTLI